MTRLITRLLAAAILLTIAATSASASSDGQATPPMTLKDRIQFGLETSSLVGQYDITVKVTGSEAVLTGTVATEAQKAEAARVAKIAGAAKIQNNLVVDRDVDVTLADRMKAGFSKTGDKISDVWITTKVKWFYWGDERLKGSDIDVDTANRVVTLKGTVPNAAARARAVALATGAEGVRRVVDQLAIAK